MHASGIYVVMSSTACFLLLAFAGRAVHAQALNAINGAGTDAMGDVRFLNAATHAVPAVARRAAGAHRLGDRSDVVATAGRAQAPPRIDGRVDDAVWETVAPVGPFYQVDPDHGSPSRAPTDVRILWDESGLYIGARMVEPGRSAGRVEGLRRDFDYSNSDVFGVVLDGFGDGRFAMAFLTNPHGVQRDLLVFDGRDTDEAWNGIWEVRTARTDDGWSAEVAIPWSTLRYLPDGDWRVNFVREARSIQETSGWSPWRRGIAVWDLTYAGRLEGLRPPPPGLNVQVQPYTVTRAEATGRDIFDDPNSSMDVGLDVKWAAAPNTVLDLTYNMDFAQAEVDRQVVNLDRFSVFFPERRTFFLESARLFDTGLDVISPFYSRRIGLDESGAPVPVTGGARITHRSQVASAGALLVRQEGVDGADGTIFGVGRYVQNVGQTGRVGALASLRHDQGLPEDGSGLNTVGAADWFFRPTRTLSTRGMISRSFTEGAGGDGWAAHAWVGNSAPWGYFGWLQEYVGGEWEPRSGFVFSRDLITTSPAFSLDVRPPWLPRFVRAYQPGVTTYLFHRASTGKFFSGTVSVRPLVLRLQNGGQIGFSILPEWQRHDQAFRPVPGITVGPGDYQFNRWAVTASHDPSARITGTARLESGPFYDGRLTTSVVTGKIALSPHVVAFGSWERNQFADVGGSHRTTDLVRPELRLAPTPRVELSGIWQYNTAADVSSLNLRLSWEFRPLSFVYLVYNERVALEDALQPLPTQRQLIVKGTWLWQP